MGLQFLRKEVLHSAPLYFNALETILRVSEALAALS
jgi:hypothetical protein